VALHALPSPRNGRSGEDEAASSSRRTPSLAFQDRARALGAELRFGVKGRSPTRNASSTAGSWLLGVAPPGLPRPGPNGR
jgi:hypothetical protein